MLSDLISVIFSAASATIVIAQGQPSVFIFYTAGCQLGPVRAFICGATVVVGSEVLFEDHPPLGNYERLDPR